MQAQLAMMAQVSRQKAENALRKAENIAVRQRNQKKCYLGAGKTGISL